MTRDVDRQVLLIFSAHRRAMDSYEVAGLYAARFGAVSNDDVYQAIERLQADGSLRVSSRHRTIFGRRSVKFYRPEWQEMGAGR